MFLQGNAVSGLQFQPGEMPMQFHFKDCRSNVPLFRKKRHIWSCPGMVIPLKAQKKVRIITSAMYSLTLLCATTLVVFGGRALIHAARAWVFNNKSAFHHMAFTFHKSAGSNNKAAQVLIEAVTGSHQKR
jgi:hypothetical protein